MKKSLIILLAVIIAMLTACDNTSAGTTTTTTTSAASSASIESTTLTEFVNPFEEYNFIRKIDLAQDAVDMIEAGTRRIAYLDNQRYFYYEIGRDASTFFMYSNGVVSEYDTRHTSSFEDYFITSYDAENNVLYASNGTYTSSVPISIDSAIELYPSRNDDVLFTNSEYSLIGNRFMSASGETLFSNGEIVVFPRQSLGDDLRFYTYESGEYGDHGCTILTYEGFSGEPIKETLVHSDLMCAEDYQIQNGYTIIKLTNFTSIWGVVIISPSGDIKVIDYELDFPDLLFGLNGSFTVEDWCIYFEYRDNNSLDHKVVIDFNLNYIGIDEMMEPIAEKTVFLDYGYSLYQPSSTYYTLYKNQEQFFSFLIRNIHPYVKVNFYGDFAVIYENSTGGEGRITRLDLRDKTYISYDQSLFAGCFTSGQYLLYEQDGYFHLYDILNDSFYFLDITGTPMKVDGDSFLIYNDNSVYLFESDEMQLTELNKIGYFQKGIHQYAFLVEYEGNYFVIG